MCQVMAYNIISVVLMMVNKGYLSMRGIHVHQPLILSCYFYNDRIMNLNCRSRISLFLWHSLTLHGTANTQEKIQSLTKNKRLTAAVRRRCPQSQKRFQFLQSRVRQIYLTVSSIKSIYSFPPNLNLRACQFNF